MTEQLHGVAQLLLGALIDRELDADEPRCIGSQQLLRGRDRRRSDWRTIGCQDRLGFYLFNPPRGVLVDRWAFVGEQIKGLALGRSLRLSGALDQQIPDLGLASSRSGRDQI